LHHYEERKGNILHIIDDQTELEFTCEDTTKGRILPNKRVLGKIETFIPFIKDEHQECMLLTVNL